MRRTRPGYYLLAAAAVLLILPCVAQADDDEADETITLEGAIVDAETGDSLSLTHVFVSGSTMGTVADEDGTYELADIPPGAHRLFVSRMGYESARLDTLLQEPGTHTLDFELEQAVLEAEEILVDDEKDEDWQDNFEDFDQWFIGESERADDVEILNPEVLSFETNWWGKFEAEAHRPLLIKNHALGYRITYFLDEFERAGTVIRWDGEPLYDPMIPEDSTQQATWEENRREAFYGSYRHFLLSALEDRVEEEGFSMYRHPRTATRGWGRMRDRFRMSADRLISDAEDEEEMYEMSFNGKLEVIYREAQESENYLRWKNRFYSDPPGPQTSYVELNERPVTIDPSGEILETYGTTVYGYFAFRRVADATPREYLPEDFDDDVVEPPVP